MRLSRIRIYPDNAVMLSAAVSLTAPNPSMSSFAVNTTAQENTSIRESHSATLDDEDDIAATRPNYKRRPLASVQPYLTVTAETGDEGTAIVRVVGDLDLSTILPFRDAAFTAIGTHPPRLQLDMSRLDRLDITGLNTLLTVGRVARLVGVPLHVRPSERLRLLLQTTGLERQLPLESAPALTERNHETDIADIG